MMHRFKAGLLATALAAVAVVPAAAVVTFASADAAHAKGPGQGNGAERGKGNGGRSAEARGERGEARGGGRPEWAGPGARGGNGAGRHESARGGSDPISNFIRGLAGEQKRDTRARPHAETRVARQNPTAHAPMTSIAPVKRPARTADPHPSELGNMNGALNANINAVLAHIRNGNTNGPVGHLAALAIADSALATADTDALTPEELAALLDAQADAEAALLSFWNRNDDPDPEMLSPEEIALLDALRARIEAHEEEIAAAVGETEEITTAAD